MKLHRLLPMLFSAMLLMLLSHHQLAAAEGDPKIGDKDGLDATSLQSETIDVEMIFPVQIKLGKWSLNRDKWMEGYNSSKYKLGLRYGNLDGSIAPLRSILYNELRQSTRNMRQETRYTSGQFTAKMWNDKVKAEMVGSGKDVTIKLYEIKKPNRGVYIVDKGNGDFELKIIASDNIEVQMNQKANDDVEIIWKKDGKVTKTLKADTFTKAQLDHRKVLDQAFYPILNHYRIQTPRSVYDSSVIEAVVDEIKPDLVETSPEVEQKLKELNSDSFPVRVQAQRYFKRHAKTLETLLRKKVKDEELAYEPRSRLQTILNQPEFEERTRLQGWVRKNGLAKNVSYLKELLPALSKEEKLVIEKQITQLENAKPNTK